MSGAPTILIVEDDAAMRRGLEDNLEIEGYDVISAATMRDGRVAAIKRNPDLIILDVMLPDGDGIELCKQLRAEGRTEPIIMAAVWGHESGTVTRTVDNFIVRLRKKLEPDPAKPRLLLTIHGRGYKLIKG